MIMIILIILILAIIIVIIIIMSQAIFSCKSRFSHWKYQYSQCADNLLFSHKKSQKLQMNLFQWRFLHSFPSSRF